MNPKPQLIEACKKGDRKAQEELYKQCFSPLISICFRFANNKDDPAILLNEAFFKILQNIEKQNPTVLYQGRKLDYFDAVIPRIGASVTFSSEVQADNTIKKKSR